MRAWWGRLSFTEFKTAKGDHGCNPYQALHSAMTRFQGIQEDAGGDSGTGTDECPAKTETLKK